MDPPGSRTPQQHSRHPPDDGPECGEPHRRSKASGAVTGVAHETRLVLAVPAQPSSLKKVRGAVREAAMASGCSEAVAHDIIMAVDEACQNIIRHAYGGACDEEMTVEILEEAEGERLVILLHDHADKVDESKVKSRDLEDVRPGGLGVHLINEVMDESGFVPTPSEKGNLYRMAIRIRRDD